MKTGPWGTFVISWSQTETDGLAAATLDILAVGAAWRWTGEAVRVDGPQNLLILDGAEGAVDVRRRAAQMVRRLVGSAIGRGPCGTSDPDPEEGLADQSLVVTDGRRSFTLTLIDVPETRARLVMVVGDLPPRDTDLWIVRTAIDRRQSAGRSTTPGGVICFAPGTRLATPEGLRLIEHLRPGDRVLTRDNGPQAVMWMGHRRMSGARLYAMPHLRPIRFRAGAVGMDEPDQDLIVSPQHRMLIRGPNARALFNVEEVLVEAADLVNDRTILIDRSLREVTYVHVLLERHNVIWANGLQTESFHPANTEFDSIDPGQRDGLLVILPGVDADPQGYGEYARRNLSASEAAILRHDMGA
jgi:hypothetical protein